MTEGFPRKTYRNAARDICDIVSIPVLAWVSFSKSRKTTEAYRSLLDIPLELSACGFTVTTVTSGDRWHIDVAKEIAEGSVLELSAEARSYAACLFQIANTAGQAIDDLERNARRRWTPTHEGTVAA